MYMEAYRRCKLILSGTGQTFLDEFFYTMDLESTYMNISLPPHRTPVCPTSLAFSPSLHLSMMGSKSTAHGTYILLAYSNQ
jgi:hypothetical protein